MLGIALRFSFKEGILIALLVFRHTMPWLISRYVASEFLRFFTLLLSAFVMMILVGNVFNHLSDIFADWAGFLRFLQETVLQLPMILELVIPVTILLATIAAFGSLNKTSEITALYASGIGGWTLITPILLLSILVGLANYGVQHYAVPWMKAQWEPEEARERMTSLWRVSGADSLYHIGLRTAESKLREVTLFRWSPETYALEERVLFNSGALQDEQWTFKQVEQNRFRPGSMSIQESDSLQIKQADFPSVNLSQSLNPHYLPLEVLYQEALRMQEEGQNVARYWVELHQKFSYHVALIVMALIGFALSASHGRRGTTAESLALSCLLGILFWMLNQIFLALGSTGLLAPWLAAWGNSLLFLGLALLLLGRNRL
jgi:lipopolysaccharide export system permease protein